MAEVLDNSGNRISAVVRSSKLAKQSKALVAELEALRTRCEELEARIEELESSDIRAAADTCDFGTRLEALETAWQGWERTIADNVGTAWQHWMTEGWEECRGPVRTIADNVGWQ